MVIGSDKSPECDLLSSFSPNISEYAKKSLKTLEKIISEKNKSVFCLISSLILDVIENSNSSFSIVDVCFIIDSFNSKNLFEEFKFFHFEWWLINKSNLSYTKQIEIREKITGKSTPRNAYLDVFPTKQSDLSHIVAAHVSPDMDTAVTSFLTWLDSFSIRLCLGVHIWNLPGGQLTKQDDYFFNKLIGEGCVNSLSSPKKNVCVIAIQVTKAINEIKISQISSINTLDNVAITNEDGSFVCVWTKDDSEKIDCIQKSLNNKQEITENLSEAFKFVLNQNIKEISTNLSIELKKNFWPTKKIKSDECINDIEDEAIAVLYEDEFIGIIDTALKNNKILATVSLRDFSDNSSKFAKNVQIVSIVDHHKCEIETSIPINIIIKPVQACSVLISNLTNKANIASKKISKERKVSESILLLTAILDDTDFLEKACEEDISEVVFIVNNLTKDSSTEQLLLDEQKLDEQKRILLNHPLIKLIYEQCLCIKKEQLNLLIQKACKENCFEIFHDTKLIGKNPVCSVCQIKLLPATTYDLKNNINALVDCWLSFCKQQCFHEAQLFVLMLSTISISNENLEDSIHDRICILSKNIDHSVSFIKNLLESTPKEKMLSILVSQNIIENVSNNLSLMKDSIQTLNHNRENIIILQIKVSSMNSRKSDISPFLPKGI